MFDFDEEGFKRMVSIVILSISLFLLIILIFPTLLYVIVIIGILVPSYYIYIKKKNE